MRALGFLITYLILIPSTALCPPDIVDSKPVLKFPELAATDRESRTTDARKCPVLCGYWVLSCNIIFI